MAKHLLCRVGWHKWVKHRNDAGQQYLTCSRCGKYNDNDGVVSPLA